MGVDGSSRVFPLFCLSLRSAEIPRVLLSGKGWENPRKRRWVHSVQGAAAPNSSREQPGTLPALEGFWVISQDLGITQGWEIP